MKTCTIDGCDKAHRARGLCSTHYNRALGEGRHKATRMQCTGCCGVYLKQVSGHAWATNYCSELCRQWVRFGEWSTKLPADHIVRWVNATCEWKPPRTARTFDCEWCGHTITTTRDSAKYCTRGCKRKGGKARRRGLEHGATGTYSWAELTRLWLAFDKTCAYCRKATQLADIQAEHVYPLSRGGANNLTNLLPSCGPCNSDKRDLLLHEWERDRARRHLPTVHTTWRATDSRYKHLTYRTNLRPSA
ncbi:HNH endonuclease [Leifsonia sp. Root227]|uniref:HNH endonuclease n=1 Tax=Leifsonia sp. Root227 TaxID=1736496 RepID=UPI0009EB4C80